MSQLISFYPMFSCGSICSLANSRNIFTITQEMNHCAYFLVHSRAVSQYLARFVLYMLATSGTRLSSMSNSVKRRQMWASALEIVRAGDHQSLRMERQIVPFWLMLGWQIRVVKLILGGRKGYSVGNWTLRKKTPPSQGLPSGPIIVACQLNKSFSLIGLAPILSIGLLLRSFSSF